MTDNNGITMSAVDELQATANALSRANALMLARMANMPAFVALYTPAPRVNPVSRAWHDIDQFRVKRVWPRPEHDWRTLSPAEWANALLQIRDWHLRRLVSTPAANEDRY